jgi:8-oxo-dGTP diphosphatase
MKPTFSIGCFAVIFDENKKVLLTHRRDRDLWVLPGGAMESGESPHDAVIREVEEETGVNVEAVNFVGLYSKPLEDDIVLLFICRKTGGNLTLNDEADQLEYYSVENIPANTNERHLGRIKDALSMSGVSILRIQR